MTQRLLLRMVGVHDYSRMIGTMIHVMEFCLEPTFSVSRALDIMCTPPLSRCSLPHQGTHSPIKVPPRCAPSPIKVCPSPIKVPPSPILQKTWGQFYKNVSYLIKTQQYSNTPHFCSDISFLFLCQYLDTIPNIRLALFPTEM